MRNLAWLSVVLGLAAAGCHAGPCGGCPDYETCDAASDACVLNDGARFDLVANDGDVPGDNWDPLWGPPDPYVCVGGLGQPENCTTAQSDTHSPKWNQTLFSDLDGAALLGATLTVTYQDSDVDSPDLICEGTATMTADYLRDGGFSFNCSNGASARFELVNTVRGTPPALSSAASAP